MYTMELAEKLPKEKYHSYNNRRSQKKNKMDATCKIQGDIHVFKLINNMCPGK